MNNPKNLFGNLSGGRVLDLATGTGGFIHFLLEGLPGITEIIGVDVNERAAAAFQEAFKNHPNIHFQVGDALNPDFAPGSFDTVCLSNSLHHFDNPRAVLAQLASLVRPGGNVLLAEMFRDNQSATQMTHVLLHHWWAAVDRTHEIIHQETFTRAEIIQLLNELSLAKLSLYDLAELDEDPKNPDVRNELNLAIDRYIQRADGHPALQARGGELRQQVSEVGFHSATTLLAIGQKR